MDTVVHETSLPSGSTPPVHEIVVRPEPRPGRLDARWVPDPSGQPGFIFERTDRSMPTTSGPSMNSTITPVPQVASATPNERRSSHAF